MAVDITINGSALQVTQADGTKIFIPKGQGSQRNDDEVIYVRDNVYKEEQAEVYLGSYENITISSVAATSFDQVVDYLAAFFNALGGGGGAVTSVFTRTGDVSAATDDYSKEQIAGLKTTDSPTFAGQTINGLANIQELRFDSKIVPAALSADTHNWAPTNLQTNGRIVASATLDIDLTGIDSTNIADGEIRILENSNGSSGRFTLLNNSASSLAANRFYLNANVVLNENQSVMLMYSANVGASGGWIIIGIN
jgi:hypothetical protein